MLHAFYGDDVCGQPVGSLFLCRAMLDGLPGAVQRLGQFIFDPAFRPSIALPILHPFQIGNRHTARVGEDVRNDDDASFSQDFVSVTGHGKIGSLYEKAGTDAIGIVLIDNSVDRRRHHDIHVQRQQFLVGDVLTLDPQFGQGSSLVFRRFPLEKFLNIEPVLVKQPAMPVADRNNPASAFRK